MPARARCSRRRASVSRPRSERFSGATFGQPNTHAVFGLVTPTLNVSYAPDVFGGTRRQIESLAAQAEYQRFQLEATYLTLTSNVVVAAVQEASLRGQIAATQDIIKDQAQQLNLVRQRFNLGGASQADVLTQEAQLAQTRATLPPLQKQLAQTRNQLTALAGQLPSHETSETFDLDSMHLPQELPVSLPSQLVEQRPDVRAAEAQLHSASAEIGVATANQLPQFTITGALGTASTGFTNMFAPGTGVWSIAGGITQTLFDAGTLLHKKRAAVAAFEQTAAQYRSTVIKACQNVADALRALQSDADALVAQAAAERSAFAEPRSGATAVSARRHRLPHAAERAADLAAGAHQPRAGRGQSLRRHGGIVPGAGRRLVASQRCRAGRRQREAALTETDMIKRMIIMLIAVGVVLGGFFAFQNFKAHIIQQVMASLANPPQTVSTTTAGLQDWQPQVEAVGSLRAVNGADLSLEVSGIVDRIDFNSGDDVAAGAVLLRLRSDDDVAKLQALQATADLAQITYDRDVKQWKAQAISQATVDTDTFNLKNARAQVEQQKAMLDKKMLRAPFAGHLGIRAVDVGQYLNAGTVVVTLQALDPIYVDFFLPQQALDQIRIGQAIAAKVDTYPGQHFAGKITADQSAGGCQLAQRAGARHARQSGSQAAARHVCHDRHRCRRAAAPHHAAADGDRL